MNNANGARVLPKSRIPKERRMEVFDSLPPGYREVLRHTITPTSFEDIAAAHRDAERGYPALRSVLERLRAAEAESTRRTYGPDHPQARRDKSEELLLSIGLL